MCATHDYKISFVLGDDWPDWWADLVTKNIAVTSNDDGRYRGGPGSARITQGQTVKWAEKGDVIFRHPCGEIEVARSVKVDLSEGAKP